MIKCIRFSMALFACMLNLCVLSSCVFVLFFMIKILKLLVSDSIYQRWQASYDSTCDGLIGLHSKNLRQILIRICGVQFSSHFSQPLSQEQSYVMVINHRSHVDILVILAVFYDQVPDVKFFLKRPLLWVPFLGQFCYLMNYVFVKKITPQTVRRDPGCVQRQRLRISQQCQALAAKPVTLAVFAEGTRYASSQQKHRASIAFNHLLAPQPAGLALALESSSQYISNLLDVTLVYDVGFVSVWSLLSGQVKEIEIHTQTFDVVQSSLVGDYVNDRGYRKRFSSWVRSLWQKKDRLLDQAFCRLRQRRTCIYKTGS